jgi:ubiquinone/menaquinone biosynthesis C-methylase UbiE
MTDFTGEDVQRFQRWSRTYERSLGQAFFFDPVHRRVVDLAAALDGHPPARVLDIGCGTGRLLRRAGRRWPAARLFGVDPADGMIEKARLLTSSASFLLGRGEEIPLPDSTVDLVFSTISFHHWVDQAAGVREVARVLRPGGCFCLADGAIPSWAGAFVPHSRMHTREEIAVLFEGAGLSVLLQRPVLGGAVLARIGKRGSG